MFLSQGSRTTSLSGEASLLSLLVGGHWPGQKEWEEEEKELGKQGKAGRDQEKRDWRRGRGKKVNRDKRRYHEKS